MADTVKNHGSLSAKASPARTSTDEGPPDVEVQDEKQFKVADSQKIGVTGAVFLILNKMIGTGSECLLHPETRQGTSFTTTTKAC